MRMYTHAANSMDEIDDFIRSRNIDEDSIVSITQSYGQFILTYFAD